MHATTRRSIFKTAAAASVGSIALVKSAFGQPNNNDWNVNGLDKSLISDTQSIMAALLNAAGSSTAPKDASQYAVGATAWQLFINHLSNLGFDQHVANNWNTISQPGQVPSFSNLPGVQLSSRQISRLNYWAQTTKAPKDWNWNKTKKGMGDMFTTMMALYKANKLPNGTTHKAVWVPSHGNLIQRVQCGGLADAADLSSIAEASGYSAMALGAVAYMLTTGTSTAVIVETLALVSGVGTLFAIAAVIAYVSAYLIAANANCGAVGSPNQATGSVPCPGGACVEEPDPFSM